MRLCPFFAHFFAHEICGFCTPCGAGTAVVVKRLDSWQRAAARGTTSTRASSSTC